MNRSCKCYQSSLKKKWFKPFEEDAEEALEIFPPNMADDDWNYLREKTGEDPSRLQLFEITHTRSNGQAANETTQEVLMTFKRFTAEVVERYLQMYGDEMFVEVFGPEHHRRVRGYGDESEERRKENDANLLRKLKESKEHRKESDTNVQLLKAQVNRVESLLAQVLKNMAPFELALSDSSS
ncbi:hypothetical protein CFP56_009948 [Quercus suber]|uniref:Uncharacterized protein n=1 Tax=Quercus suber TaxID=58331 RepID=A0AAW0KZY5_QUESU